MVTARLSIPVAMLVLALGGAPTIARAATPEPDFVSVNPRGSTAVERDGDAFIWTTDLFSLTTLEKIGSFTDRATCATSTPPPCLVYAITTTYRVPGGDVVSHGQWSAGPDPTQPGVYFIGSRPHSDTVVAGTGRFQGRTGRVSGWGILDLRQFPDGIGVDVRAFIRFAPNDAHVLGSRELMVPHEPPGADRFQTELFLSEGANQSKDPARFVLNTPLLSLSDRSHIGTVTDSFTCAVSPPPCLVMELTPVLQYPDGTITIRTEVPMAPDPVRQGFFLFGARPTENNIVSATGAYAGRTGQLSVSGTVDMRRAPSTVPYEGVGVLVFDD
jgi:hypothetical protein